MTAFLTGRQILVVEDEMLVLMQIERTLEELGSTAVRGASSIARALALLDRYKFDAAIIDINLRGERSYPVADALVRLGVPFAFSTGYGDHGERVDFNDRPILRKPYVRSALVAAFRRLLTPEPLPAAA